MIFAPRFPRSPGHGPVVAIDASRNRSGGARHHLAGLLTAADPRAFGIQQVHLWSYPALARAIPPQPWLVTHTPPALSRSLAHQLWWQRHHFPKELRACGCEVLLNTSAATLTRFSPTIAMSRDLLAFEPGERERYGLSASRLRLEVLRRVQVHAFRRATGVLFLTEYAARQVQDASGLLPTVRVIPHGISDRFRMHRAASTWPAENEPIRCVYVSNTDMYKHQWQVVEAIAELRRDGYPVVIDLIGGGSGPASTLLDQAVQRLDPQQTFVNRREALPHEAIPAMLERAHVFVFASSCENLPNTLLEGMAAGLPIACSNRGPMPEVLGDAGTYFNPEDPRSIAGAIRQLIDEPVLREQMAARARALANEYTWTRSAAETWQYILDVWSDTQPRMVPA